MPTEADTCRTLITPKLQAAGWENDPHSIAEQRSFTDGRIGVHGTMATRRKLTDHTAEKVRTLCVSPDELCARWADAGQRADIIQQLAERGIQFASLAAQAGQPDADPFGGPDKLRTAVNQLQELVYAP